MLSIKRIKMALEDLRFNDRDVRRILRIAKKRETRRVTQINASYDSAVTYDDLMAVAGERGLNLDVVRGVVESGAYKRAGRVCEVLGGNVLSLAEAGIAAFVFWAGAKYLGDSQLRNPLIYAAVATTIVDALEYQFTSRRGNLTRTVQNDVGTFAGHATGMALAALV